MANWEYHNSFLSRSWDLPSGRNEQGRQLTFGFWLRETIDRPTARSGPLGYQLGHEIYGVDSLQDREIRVLNLRPGRDGEPLAGYFDVVKARFESCYEALSYAWGNPDRNGQILIDTLSGCKALRMTSNLASALTHLRSGTEVRRLWIDAICINQENLVEKSAQVAGMARVYREAKTVLVWLGEETAHSLLGMTILEDICLGKVTAGETSWLDLPPEILEPALRDILERPWFKRLWVVQEAALARVVTMICGQDYITWTSNAVTVATLDRRLKLAAISPRYVDAGLGKIQLDDLLQLLERQLLNGPEAGRWRWAMGQQKPDLLSSAYSYRDRQAMDPRDKIYALLSLVDDPTAKKLAVDYSESVTDLFDRVIKVVNEQSEELFRNLSQTYLVDSDMAQPDIDPPSISSRVSARERVYNTFAPTKCLFEGGQQAISTQAPVCEGSRNTLAHTKCLCEGGQQFATQQTLDEPMSQNFPTWNAEYQCLTAIRHMRNGNLDMASTLLGRATELLDSELRRQSSGLC